LLKPGALGASRSTGRARPAVAATGAPTNTCGRKRPGTTLMPSLPPGLSCLKVSVSETRYTPAGSTTGTRGSA
jgi:hypothetical protein